MIPFFNCFATVMVVSFLYTCIKFLCSKHHWKTATALDSPWYVRTCVVSAIWLISRLFA